MNSKDFCALLKKMGFDFYTGVPCSILKNVISYLEESDEFEYIPATREDEALAISSGAYMGGKKPVVLMQNSGFGCSIGVLTSLIQLYKFPMLMIISWRGYKGKDAPEHLIMGAKILDLLKVLEIPIIILSREDVEKEIKNGVKTMEEKNVPVAMILRRGVLDESL